MSVLKLFAHLIIITLLTIITQVGGVIWIISLLISNKLKKKKRIIFPLLYFIFNLIIVPPVASYFGREQLPVFNQSLKPINWFYPLAFRNYVVPRLKRELISSSENLASSNISIIYLDANFPFFKGYPLLPHLSHNDGKKIDITFMYLNELGEESNKKPSTSGYGAFANSEKNYTSKTCIKKGNWQYDFTKYLSFGINNKLKLDSKRTTQLIKQLLSISSTEKLFIEPHLKQSLSLSRESKVRFHGCKAVRHDDHIHLQIN
ncbi:hypothetical protein [Winogradskyella sp. UBA3174]|uniref:hypothetical protein n=1 Tax=Winogradskyella sp. UBA3174 TaxID=1947785 RepID=UPI0025D45FEC|nr:hypothetical protein [Winogradskyella sp. UBA3174]|tara:strand:+ start:4646 stop:5428 length:783 start_codon:yes stop_codon:yes gene_type:complete